MSTIRSLNPAADAGNSLPCGCIRGAFLCPRAVRLWDRYRVAHTVIAADNAWNSYWRHIGDDSMLRRAS